VKARAVKHLDPGAPLADNAERIVRTRLDELLAFMPRAADPDEVVALHDMRIAAKRLRYVLEVTGPCFGPYAESAVKLVKELQDLLGEIHDCDVQLPEVAAYLAELAGADAAEVVAHARGADDVDPAGLRDAPNRSAYAGLVALQVHLQARRDHLFGRFLAFWGDVERKGFAARLRYALAERADGGIMDDGA
jgi:hypothetical protein